MSIKTSIPKVDGMGLVLGKPAYTDDLAPRDALIVKVLRSPHAHAKITSIDVSSALAIPEIKCVLTHENVPDHVFSRAGQGFPEPSPYDARILNKTVRYIGDAVAVIAGATEKVVDLAMSKIKVSYEVLPAIIDFEEAMDHKVLIHANDETSSMFPIGHDAKRNLAAQYEMKIGDMGQTLDSCDVVIKERYFTQAQAHAMTEPHSAVAYYDFQDRLTIISATQTPFHVRRILAKNLNIPLSTIRVIKPRIGGGYGGKQAIHGEFFVALVTQMTKRPAKLIYTRKEVFTASYTRHQMRIDITLGAMNDGTLKAIDVDILSNTGAYGEHALTVLMVAGSKTLPLYNHVDAVGFRGDVVYTNLTPAGAFRGYGAIQGNFALESIMDELADKLKLDPIELRRKNMIHEGETSKIFEVMGEGTEGTAMTVESCKLEECLDSVLTTLDWQKKYPRTQVDEHTVRGVGLALAMQGSGIPYIDMASAILKLNDDGFFNLLIGATDLGTGSDTILSQIAAETLGVPDDKIIVYSSDTDLTPFDTGAYASSTTYISGHSVRIAAERMREAIVEKANRFFKVTDAQFDGENITAADTVISLKEFATTLYYSQQQEQLVAHGSYVGTKSPPPYMVGACEVEVDKRTGRIKVLEYHGAVDCGTPINPNLARIQVEGALLQGIGMTLYEEVNYLENGSVFNNSFMRYKVPTRMDVGPMHVSFEESYEPSGPYGAKSVGEIGIDTPPAAIANAIFNATGVRIRSLPITSESLWNALNQK
ncbi:MULTISPECIES: xanthine dehydrogenase family protein molybdopterin-binding subunit [unclassified Fusibacter]|uniref:xanthine dehydrogenase family protein molybdopterin-binding subunit n=1 Tax=unclassified Fusibacter TaxID=2624464 RepID=UPI00101120B1|nr:MULTISPECIES: molybdopterin cofactor-binding domain-containing protein [unclassified Fusibacter]MCK8060396.1 molybdopterin-dependent oxidoreductase [Fusibacter sp. A2]NPE20315.1 molybdopterin-dependent oxidoreductase [Fusibacter sp. A1]RXV63521.1 aldehyde oxidase [Fusibacter sp. A1]